MTESIQQTPALPHSVSLAEATRRVGQLYSAMTEARLLSVGGRAGPSALDLYIQRQRAEQAPDEV